MKVFIDYVSLLLLNMTAGYVILAAYVYRGMDNPDQKRWVPAFGLVGLIAFVFGTHMTATWPIIGAYNCAYGEMSVLFGGIFLAAALALALGWDLLIIAVYAFFAGIAAVVLGIRIINLKMTLMPVLSGMGFILSGLGGVFAAPTLTYFRQSKVLRTLAAIVLLAAALIWALTVYPEYWVHMKTLGSWQPSAMMGSK